MIFLIKSKQIKNFVMIILYMIWIRYINLFKLIVVCNKKDTIFSLVKLIKPQGEILLFLTLLIEEDFNSIFVYLKFSSM